MNKLRKSVAAGLLTSTLILANVTSVFAAYSDFSKAYVNGNQYTYITRKDKETSNKYVKVLVDTMYKTDNKKAPYKKSKVQLRGWNGTSYVRCTISDDYGKTVKKGTEEKFQLLKDYQKIGKTVKYYAKGNNPDVDCKITGTLTVD